MRTLLRCFSLTAFVAFAISPTLKAGAPEAPSEAAWEKIPGATHHPAIRDARLRLRLAPLSAKETEQALQQIVAHERSPASAADFLVATELLAAKAGAPALTFAQNHRAIDVTPRSVREAFVRGWAKADVDTAAAWLDSTPIDGWDDDEKVELARVILKSHARRDPTAAMQRALRYADTEPSRRETFALAVIEELVYLGRFETARKLAQKIAVPEMRSAVYADLIGLVAEHQPALATTWFRKLPADQERLGMIFRLTEAWTTRSLADAVAFLDSLEPAERSIDLVESMLVNSNDPRPADVEKIAGQFPAGPELDRLLTAALNRISLLSPSEIPWNWLGRFTSPRARDQMLVSLLAQRFRDDPSDAKRIVDGLDFMTAEQRQQLLAFIARNNGPDRHQNQPTPPAPH